LLVQFHRFNGEVCVCVCVCVCVFVCSRALLMSPHFMSNLFLGEPSRVVVIVIVFPAVLRGRYRRRYRPVLPAVLQASSLSSLRCCRCRRRLPCGAAGVVPNPCFCDACGARAYSLPLLSPCGAAGVVVLVLPAVLQASSSSVPVMHVAHARIRYHYCLPAVLQASPSWSSLRCCRRRRSCPPCGAAGVVVVFPAVLQASTPIRVFVMQVAHARSRYQYCFPAVLQASSSWSFPAVLQASSSLSSLRCCRRRRRCRRPPCGAAGVVVVSEQTDVHAAHPCEFASVKWARM
jgi:hypothetical protein